MTTVHTREIIMDAKVIATIPELDQESCIILLNSAGATGYDAKWRYNEVDELRLEVKTRYLAGKIDGAEIIVEYNDQPE